MNYLLSPPFLIPSIALILLSFILNGLMIKAMICEWVHRRRLSPRDQILLSLSASNLACTILELQINFIFESAFVVRILYVWETFAVQCRCWFTAWLSIFLCIKIVSCNHYLFHLCKLKISAWVPWGLLGSMIISLFPSFPAFWNFTIVCQRNSTGELSDLAENFRLRLNVPYFVLLLGLFLPPLFLVLLCSILTVASLFRHVCRLTGQGPQFTHSQMKAHVKAAIALLTFFFFYLFLTMVDILMMFEPYFTNPSILLTHTLASLFFAPVQAAILIAVNPQLRQEVACLLPCWLLPEPRPFSPST
ncbi:taste receptor type 2 member 41-like [Pogona vitticeps]